MKVKYIKMIFKMTDDSIKDITNLFTLKESEIIKV